MRKPRVTSWVGSSGIFHFDVPVDDRNRMREFRKELIRRIGEKEFPVVVSEVKKRGFCFFEIATDLSQKEIETLANQALQAFEKISKKERRK